MHYWIRAGILAGAVVFAHVGCSGSTSPPVGGGGSAEEAGGSGDGAAMIAVDAGSLTCGNPGDMGNALGVGKYCNGLGDCTGNTQATLCATLGDPMLHFCTFLCAGMTSTECGTGASCQCQNGECGCVPDSCLK